MAKKKKRKKSPMKAAHRKPRAAKKRGAKKAKSKHMPLDVLKRNLGKVQRAILRHPDRDK